MLDQPVRNVDLGLFHARMLTLLRSTFPQTAMDIVLREQLPNGFQSVYFPPTNNTVGVYYGGDNTRKVMYLDGISNNTQAVNLVGGYSSALGLRIINGANVWIQEQLNTYLGMMSGGHLQTPEYTDFVGYSAGGAVATCLADRLRELQSVQKVKVFTYGAPRPGASRVRDHMRRTPIVRYMTPGDPIPLVPPTLQDAPTLAPLVPVPVLLSWSSMVHTQGGVQIRESGSTEERILPSDASMNPGTSLASWYFSLDGGLQGPHAMQTYVAYLVACSRVANTPAEKIIDIGPAEVEAVAERRAVNQGRERVEQKIALQQRNQANTIVNQPAVVLFKPVRFGRVWGVVFGEQIVCQGVREDTCRHLCRAGNDFLRSLPKQGLVDPIALLDRLETFLAYATAPESDWLPKLQTNLDLG